MTDDVVLVWDQIGPYHVDRCEALGVRLQGQARVHGIEIATRSEVYAWGPSGEGTNFTKHTLFETARFEDTAACARVGRLVKLCWILRARDLFLSNYSRLDVFAVAVIFRLLGRRIWVMQVSKFDDKPRYVWREALKMVYLAPYCGALAAGPRTEAYLRFLGFRRRPIVTGQNAVALDRLAEAGGGFMAPDGPSFEQRHFVLVGRFVPKKDVATAVAAYARYRELAGDAAREFHLCGAGPLEPEIRAQIAALGLRGVVLHGFLQRDGIARVLAGGLCLVLPSIEEQWGLVVNEALAFCLPILATDQIGARDLLIRTGVNGYVFEPGNVEGLARLMVRVAEDETEWRRLVGGARELRPLADVERFADAVQKLVGQRT